MKQHMPSIVSLTTTTVVPTNSTSSLVSHHYHSLQLHHQKSVLIKSATLSPQSPVLRPEDLCVKPWYTVNEHSSASKNSPVSNAMNPNQSMYLFSSKLDNNNYKEAMSGRTVDIASTRTSSIESENPRSRVPRRTCMDLNDAIALLDEIYSNTDTSPCMTPKTPRTPITPHPRNKRARSKSSDNSSNYSGERLNEKILENVKSQEERKRPFLKKIGISMTEDRPLLAKLAPKIKGKPYLEKIGPSRAVDKPYLENIGSSKTIDKFIFDTPTIKKRQDTDTSNKTIMNEEADEACIERRDEIRGFTTGERRKSGKKFLLKMYSFETEDLEESSFAVKSPHLNPLRGSSLDDIVDSKPNNMPCESSCTKTNSDIETPSVSIAELVKCRITTSEEIISSNSCLNSPMEVIGGEHLSKKSGHLHRNHKNNICNSEIAFQESQKHANASNLPVKKIHASAPKKVTAVYKENKEFDRVKNNRKISEGVSTKEKSGHEQLEGRNSSDNLTKEKVAFAKICENTRDINAREPNTSNLSTNSDIKQLYSTFENQDIFEESYADFKRRTQSNFHTSNALKRLIVREKTISPSYGITSTNITDKTKPETSPKFRSKSAESGRKNCSSNNPLEHQNRKTRTQSVLRKQQGIDNSHYSYEQHELQSDSSQHRKIIHEPSQETLDLLLELQKVKSLLKTPTFDKSYEINNTMRFNSCPKRILLSDKEFCLSTEQDNNVQKPSKINNKETKHNNMRKENKSSEKKVDSNPLGPALFEKGCLSLDFVDEDKLITQKTESTSSAISTHSKNILELSEIALITRDSTNYNSNILSTSSHEIIDKTISKLPIEKEIRNMEIRNSNRENLSEALEISQLTQVENKHARQSVDKNNSEKSEISNTFWLTGKIETIESSEEVKGEIHDNIKLPIKKKNHYSDISDATLEPQDNPTKKSQDLGNTSDSLEISSSKAMPLRMKKRLDKISTEETVKQESFAENKVDCKAVAVQKRAKCLPL